MTHLAQLRPPTSLPTSTLSGLCVTCNAAGRCMYLRFAQTPVWRCEEFDDSVASSAAPALAVAPPPTSPSVHSAGAGLCVNCDSRAHCTLPRAPGGVWQCEEYS